MKYYYKFIILLLLTVLLGLGLAQPTTAQEPPVLAFYYAWFDQNTWTSGQSVDLPAEPYRSADRAVIERHVAQAQGAGINAFVQSWYGPQIENNQTETNFGILLDVAQARGFKAAVHFEVAGPFFGDITAVSNGLSTLMATHVQHPAYLRYQGKPVIFFWRQQRFSVDAWAGLRNQLDPERNTYWIAEGVDLAYQAVFDGHHLYSIAWAGSPADQLAKWGNRVRAYEAENQVDRLWVATAMPGYDDTRLPRANSFAVPRNGGDYYRQTWQGAVASRPDMIIVTSFNEWLEGTQLEPSASYGNLYLDITRELVANLRGSPPPAPAIVASAAQEVPPQEETAAQDSLPEDAQVQPPPESNETESALEDEAGQTEEDDPAQQEPLPTGPYIQTIGITNVRSGPDTTFETVGRLAEGQAVTVTGRAENVDWWLIDFEAAPDGVGWVSGEVVDFVGDADDVPLVTAEAEGIETDVEAEPVEEIPTITVPPGGVNVRSGPGLEFDLLGRLDENETVEVIARDESGDWLQVEYAAGEDEAAWVAAVVVEFEGDLDNLPVAGLTGEIEVAAPTATPTAPRVVGSVEATAAINVRAEPSTESTVLGGMYLGDTADVLALSDDEEWWLIEFSEAPDQPAWVAAEFVRFTGDRNGVPIFGGGTPTPTPEATATPPTVTPVITPIPVEQPTFAPTATSLYEATSAALLAQRGTPDPSLVESSGSANDSGFDWRNIPWGILSLIVIAGFLWYQFVLRRQR